MAKPNAEIDDPQVLAAVKRLAAQKVQGHSDEIPLTSTLPGAVDTSCGGRYWVQFRKADCAQKDQLAGAGLSDLVSGGVVRRQQSQVAIMDQLISMGLIRAAVLPALGDSGELTDQAWPQDEASQKRLIRPRKNTEDLGMSWETMTLIVELAFDFYFGDEKVVEALGESSTESATKEDALGTTDPESSTL